MLRFGICTPTQYARASQLRTLSGSAISFSLLEVSEDAGEDEIRRFEHINLALRTTNGTFRTTFRRRFTDVDLATIRIIKRFYRNDAELFIQDRAASHGLTSCELAEQLFQVFPRAHFEASDTLLYLFRISLTGGKTYIVDSSGRPLQYISPPFVVNLSDREPLRYPLNYLIATRARRRFRYLPLSDGWMESHHNERYTVSRMCCMHPQARQMMKTDPRFQMCVRSVFEHTPGIDVLRTMNILNKAYFTAERLVDGANAAFQTLK